MLIRHGMNQLDVGMQLAMLQQEKEQNKFHNYWNDIKINNPEAQLKKYEELTQDEKDIYFKALKAKYTEPDPIEEDDEASFFNPNNHREVHLSNRKLGLQYPFTNEEFKEIIDNTFTKVNELVKLKGDEYAGEEDRLGNFRKQAKELDLTMEQIWSVYASKHWSAVTQYIKDVSCGKERKRMETIDNRCDDLIVYLLLFKAMTVERTAND